MNVLISQYISPENEDMYRLMDIHFFIPTRLWQVVFIPTRLWQVVSMKYRSKLGLRLSPC